MGFDLTVTDRHLYIDLGGESLAGVLTPVALMP